MARPNALAARTLPHVTDLYFEWTYKAKGKTVNVKLTRDVMPMFRAASHQYRKLRSLLNRLETLSQTVLRHQAKLAQHADRD